MILITWASTLLETRSLNVLPEAVVGNEVKHSAIPICVCFMVTKKQLVIFPVFFIVYDDS